MTYSCLCNCGALNFFPFRLSNLQQKVELQQLQLISCNIEVWGLNCLLWCIKSSDHYANCLKNHS